MKEGTLEASLMIIQSAMKWAQAEFGGVELGDMRRTARVCKMATALAQSPGGTLPDPISKWRELKAAYRLLSNPAISFERLLQPHWARTQSACAARGEYLLIEDTTELDYTSHEAVEGLGRIGNDRGRGFFLHTTLAARIERWSGECEPVLNVQGLFWQQLFTRTDATRKGRVRKNERLKGPRESQRWAKALDQSGGPPPGTKWTHVGDCESDIAEVFAKTRAHDADFIVRANQPRAIVAEEGNLFELAARAPVKGNFEVPLRARPGQPARTATVQVRARELTIRGPYRPDKKMAAETMNVVEIKELHPASGAEPLYWVLLTSWPCDTLEQCRAVAQAYAARWLIEEYHKALKSGTGVEESQLETAHGLQSLLAVLSLVAVRLLGLKMAARADPDKQVDLDLLGEEVWAVLAKTFGTPATGWTQRATLVCIARLGGFLARKGDGDPGWLTIWRGWRRLVVLSEGYSLGH
jgi:hypothetical protein